jgi:hypothetical protein
MGRRKRIRKERAARRRGRSDAAVLLAAARFFADQKERSDVREAIEAADLPEGVKMFVGFLVDPLGAAQVLFVKSLDQKRAEQRG